MPKREATLRGAPVENNTCAHSDHATSSKGARLYELARVGAVKSQSGCQPTLAIDRLHSLADLMES